MELTREQIYIIKHTLGLTKTSSSYRNRFVTGKGSRDYPTCEKLVELGLMTRHQVGWVLDNVYMVTDEGKRAIGIIEPSKGDYGGG